MVCESMDLPIDYTKANQFTRRLVRQEYYRRQKGLCYYCNISLKKEPIKTKTINAKPFPDCFFKYPVHLHHNHKTGMTIGAVHAYCNAVLWQYHKQ